MKLRFIAQKRSTQRVDDKVNIRTVSERARVYKIYYIRLKFSYFFQIEQDRKCKCKIKVEVNV